uniref:Ena/VASP-like protein n=1 Tax=Tetraodon nigroviridis TaxID=99883 RepID=H3CZH1_TETNG
LFPSEQSICQARASVMVYDDTSKKWVPIKPGQQGFSRINIYHNTANNTFRVVGVKLQDQQVVINYSIVKGLKYNQATPTFHQWRDARQVYGLNFASKEEATTFSNAMLFALNVLSAQDGASVGPAVQRPVQNGPTSDEIEVQRARQMMEQQQQMQAHMERERRSSNSGSPFQGHPAVLSVAPPVIPPPMNMGGPPPPPPPPGPPPPSAGAPQPPLPPPLPMGGGSHGDEPPAQTGLAAMIAGAKLRRVQRPDDNSSSGKNEVNRTSGGNGGLMEEMNALLARRRKAASEKPEDSQNDDPNSSSPNTRSGQNATDGAKKPWDRANSADRSMVSSLEYVVFKKLYSLCRVRTGAGGSDSDIDFDRMKQEILEEVFRELHKVRDEILDAIRNELSRVSTT